MRGAGEVFPGRVTESLGALQEPLPCRFLLNSTCAPIMSSKGMLFWAGWKKQGPHRRWRKWSCTSEGLSYLAMVFSHQYEFIRSVYPLESRRTGEGPISGGGGSTATGDQPPRGLSRASMREAEPFTRIMVFKHHVTRYEGEKG